MKMAYQRAETKEQKKQIIDRLFKLWTDPKNDDLRLSQMIWNTFQGGDFFHVEDYDFIAMVENHHTRNPHIGSEFKQEEFDGHE